MTCRAVFFDFDGVIVDSVHIKTEAFVALYAGHGSDIMEAVKAYHLRHGGTSRYDKFRYYQRDLLGAPDDDATIDALASRFEKEVKRRVIETAEIPGALATLTKLRGQMPLYLASATPQEELREIAAGRKLEGYFSGIYGTPLKKRDIMAAEIAKYDFEPTECLMVGDAMADYEAAEANGVPFVGIVKAGTQSPFPAGTEVMCDLTAFAERALR